MIVVWDYEGRMFGMNCHSNFSINIKNSEYSFKKSKYSFEKSKYSFELLNEYSKGKFEYSFLKKRLY